MLTTPFATRWMESKGFRIPLMTSGIIGLLGAGLLFTVNDSSFISVIGAVLAIFGISNGIQNIGLQNLLYSFIAVSESGITAGLLMTSRYVGNILASSVYGFVFASGMTDSNMHLMTMVLFVVAILIIPGMLYVTGHERKAKF